MSVYLVSPGNCLIDSAARELSVDGVALALSPKVFDCLVYLVEQRDRAVGRDELIQAVWGKADVTDDLLGQVILKARRAVGDTGSEQRVIRTVPRFGYRWVAEVELRPDAPAARPAAGTPAPAREPALAPSPDPVPAAAPIGPAEAPAGTGRRHAGPAVVIVVAAALTAIVGAGIWLLGRPARPLPAGDPASPASPPQAVPAVPAMVILPTQVTAAAEWDWAELGVMEVIANRLRGAGVEVVPSESTVALSRSLVADPVVGLRETTGVGLVVRSQAVLEDGRWRVTVTAEADADRPRVSASAWHADLLVAAPNAVDQLLERLGHPADRPAPASAPAGDLLARVDAAMLAGDQIGAYRQLEAAPESLRAAPDIALRLADVEIRLNRLSAAQQRLQHLSQRSEVTSDPVAQARVDYLLGKTGLHANEPAAALAHLDRALERIRRQAPAEHADLRRILIARAIAYASQGQYERAVAEFSSARAEMELARSPIGLAAIESNEAIIEIRLNRPALALPLLERAAGRYARIGSQADRALCHARMIEVYLALLEPAQAAAAFEAVRPLLAGIDDTTRRDVELYHVHLLIRQGRLSEARTEADRLANLAGAMQTGEILGQVRGVQARLAQLGGEHRAAADLAAAGVALLPMGDLRSERAAAWLIQVRALLDGGDATAAAGQVAAFAAWTAERPEVQTAYRLALAQAALADHRGDRDTAFAQYRQALDLTARDAVPAQVGEAAADYATALIAAGRLDEARGVVARLSRFADRDVDAALAQLRLYHALGEVAAWRAALLDLRALAGERTLPADLQIAPAT